MKQKTPMMKLIEWLDTSPVRISHDEIHTKATELLAEEREGIEQAYRDGYMEHEDPDSEYYFTQTYGGGDE